MAAKDQVADFPDLRHRSECGCRMPKRMFAVAAAKIRWRSDFPQTGRSTISKMAEFKPTYRGLRFQQSRRGAKPSLIAITSMTAYAVIKTHAFPQFVAQYEPAVIDRHLGLIAMHNITV
jgi:hypothetical protein